MGRSPRSACPAESKFDGSPPIIPPGDQQANARASEGSVESTANADGTAAADADEVDRIEASTNEATATSTRGALRVTLLWPEAVPATDVMVYVSRSQRYLPYTALARGTTDDSGAVVFTGVPLGAASLISDRCKTRYTEGGTNRLGCVIGPPSPARD